jgi:glutaredoxin-like YruB-family protein
LTTYRTRAALMEALTRPREELLVGFFGSFSPASARAWPEFEAFCAAHPELPALIVDVGEVKELHLEFEVKAVPTVLWFKHGEEHHRVVGAQTREGYEALLRSEPAPGPARTGRVRRVTVFTSPHCVWCTRVKTYLRAHEVSFTEVDVARDEASMRRLLARSGQKGVPQIDVDGQLIVGFDKPRLDTLLELSP